MTAVKNRWPSGLDKKTSTEKFLARSVEGDAVGGSCGVVEFNGAVVLVDNPGKKFTLNKYDFGKAKALQVSSFKDMLSENDQCSYF